VRAGVQVVLDANVLVSVALSPDGVCGRLLAHLVESAVELVMSPLLFAEVERVLADPRLDCDPQTQSEFLEHLRKLARLEDDPAPERALVEADPGDDYLLQLALAGERLLVSGDAHLLGLAGSYPIVPPRELLDRLEERSG
jgi:putative PIN family toxin of toxin-antitoxin system